MKMLLKVAEGKMYRGVLGDALKGHGAFSLTGFNKKVMSHPAGKEGYEKGKKFRESLKKKIPKSLHGAAKKTERAINKKFIKHTMVGPKRKLPG